ncbi:MAG: murein biosynthesis integral membrane protein MurJ [Patescibacteria group bacterium]|jgi:putative peptidoglycan lipid II flippase
MKRIAAFFSKENSIRGASIILIITYTLSNVLGLFRDRFLTKNISTSDLDIYYAAFRIPDFIFNVLILGAITSAFIPIFSDFLGMKKKEEGFKVANYLINLAILTMLILGVIFFFIMPWAIYLVADFDASRMAETVKYSRMLMLLPIFFSLSYITGGMLNAMKRFAAYGVAPLVYNVSIIAGAIYLAPRFGLIGVVAMVIVGSFLHFLIQFISAYQLGYRYRPIISFTAPPIKRIIRLMVPRTISMGSTQVLLLFFTRIASALVAGSVAAFNLANNIVTMPVAVLGTTFSTAVFPTLAAKISENKPEEFYFYLNRSLRAIGYVLIPSTVIFVLLRAQIVRLILGSGKFTWEDTRTTALTLGFLSISILAQGLIPMLSKAFYALKNTRTPMFISIATMIVSVILAWPLSKSYGLAGLALTFSIGNFFNAIVLFYYLQKSYKKVLDRNLLGSYFNVTIISLVMGLTIWTSAHFLANYVDMTRFVGVLIQAGVSAGIGVIVFLGLSYIFKLEEMKWAFTRRINGETKVG